ncbi:hypothetical protein FKR81_10980 [Lentzea tibetensis]|uniref:DUF5666 domain-containing protein n=1 Tax=Lentzea tibetensis TaxID=2591470 RepID=A0A563EWP9_9PSEU|nr:hypothetical protein [Lentzea tibetensis]TWP52099.1 hypothetical protein FKR81_10980 [Lentzea tibetensis]
MSDEQQATPEWGAEQPQPKNQWNAKKTIAAVAIAVGITAAGGVAIYAASGTQAATGGGPGGQMGGPPGGDGGMMRGGPLADFPHGEFQTGEVTSISDSSVEVKSTDGYTKAYVIDSDTVIEGVEKGDTVTVVATEADGKTTAEAVTEPRTQGQGQRPTNGGTPPTK